MGRGKVGRGQATPNRHSHEGARGPSIRQGWDQFPADGLRDDSDLVQEFPELIGVERLGPVGQGTIRVLMDLDHEAVGTGRHGRPGHRGDLRSDSGSVAGIGDDGEMGEGLHHRNGGEIQEISGLSVEAPHTSFTEDHIGVPFRDHIFGCQEKLFDGGGKTMKHIVLHSVKEIDQDKVVKLLNMVKDK